MSLRLYEGGKGKSHIQPRRLWAYVHTGAELERGEYEHVSDCARCLELFRLCVICDSAEQAEAEISRHSQQR
jgi:hypothetical protein